MHKKIIFLGFILGLSAPLLAQAEIYKHVAPDGSVTYSNIKSKGATKLDIETADTNSNADDSSGAAEGATAPRRKPSAAKTPTPASFPKVDPDKQKERDSSRKQILQAELDTEKKALEDAKQAFAAGQEKPEIYRTKDGKILRNVNKYDEKLKTLQAEVDAHQRNIELLEKEISNIN